MLHACSCPNNIILLVVVVRVKLYDGGLDIWLMLAAGGQSVLPAMFCGAEGVLVVAMSCFLVCQCFAIFIAMLVMVNNIAMTAFGLWHLQLYIHCCFIFAILLSDFFKGMFYCCYLMEWQDLEFKRESVNALNLFMQLTASNEGWKSENQTVSQHYHIELSIGTTRSMEEVNALSHLLNWCHMMCSWVVPCSPYFRLGGFL